VARKQRCQLCLGRLLLRDHSLQANVGTRAFCGRFEPSPKATIPGHDASSRGNLIEWHYIVQVGTQPRLIPRLAGVYSKQASGRWDHDEQYPRQSAAIRILATLAGGTVLAQSPPPAPDPQSRSRNRKNRRPPKDKPVQQQDTVNPKIPRKTSRPSAIAASAKASTSIRWSAKLRWVRGWRKKSSARPS